MDKIPNWFPEWVLGAHRFREVGIACRVKYLKEFPSGFEIKGGPLKVSNAATHYFSPYVVGMQSNTTPDFDNDIVLLGTSVHPADEYPSHSIIDKTVTLRHSVREVLIPTADPVTKYHYQSKTSYTDPSNVEKVTSLNLMAISPTDAKPGFAIYGVNRDLEFGPGSAGDNSEFYIESITTWIVDETGKRWERTRAFIGGADDLLDPSTSENIEQDYIALYRDAACTIKYSEHWSSHPDSRPVTPVHQLTVPYAGILMSDIFPVYLRCKPGFKTRDPVVITIDDMAYNQGGQGVKNRWMIGLDPLLRGSWWGEPLVIEKVITSTPLIIYVRARTLGPVKINFSEQYDVDIDDFNTHFMIKAFIKRA